MVDPGEVRVGNWLIKDIGEEVCIREIIQYRQISPNEDLTLSLKNCSPIRVTSAILGVSGFKHEFGDWYINRPAEGIVGGLPLLRYHYEDGYWYLAKMRLWSQPVYLHQLQNLYFALSYKELSIRLADLHSGSAEQGSCLARKGMRQEHC